MGRMRRIGQIGSRGMPILGFTAYLRLGANLPHRPPRPPAQSGCSRTQKAVPFDFVSLAKSTYNRVPGDLISEEESERREEVLRRLVVSP